MAVSGDILIIGGGAMGLWAAVKAGLAGANVLLVDEGRLGGGASNGHLGALMAFMPDKWDTKKQFQFDALLTLEKEVASLEALTGLSAGYRRTGRLMLLPKPHLRDIALRHQEDARTNWKTPERQYEWRVIDEPPVHGWPDPAGIEGGYVLDTFAARANPRAFTALLVAVLRQLGNVKIRENIGLSSIDGTTSTAELANGEKVCFDHCIIAAGYKSFPLIEGLLPPLQKPLGMPVKGQSAIMQADMDPALPTIYLDGLYVIAHEGGRVAIGSTSENRFEDSFSTDEQLEMLISRARTLVPALRDAPVTDRWAGLRPKAMERDPLVGLLPGSDNIHALTGGFKVSFGIAHKLADAVLAPILNRAVAALPDSFRPEHHIR